MTLRVEMVLAKATAGRELSIGSSTDLKCLMSRPEYAIYLRGVKKEPLWLVKLIHADDSSYVRLLVNSMKLDLELNFVLHDVHQTAVNYQKLAATLLLHYVRRGQCTHCNGTGRSRWTARSCGHCQGEGVTPLYDKDVATAAGMSPATYSRRRATYNQIVGRMLTELEHWHAMAFRKIRKNIG